MVGMRLASLTQLVWLLLPLLAAASEAQSDQWDESWESPPVPQELAAARRGTTVGTKQLRAAQDLAVGGEQGAPPRPDGRGGVLPQPDLKARSWSSASHRCFLPL